MKQSDTMDISKNSGYSGLDTRISNSTSSSRKTLSQCFAALSSNIVMFMLGSFLGFTTVIVTELYKKDPEIKASKSEITWLSSFLFLTPFGAMTVGTVAQRFGSRRCMMLASLLYSVSWLIDNQATSSTMLLVAIGIVGAFFANSPAVTYAAEITEPQLRNVVMATCTLSLTLGSFVTVLLGMMMHWRSVVLVNLTLSVVGFVAMHFIPDSPHWLASKGRFEEAEKALAWLRGWTSVEEVKPEFTILKESRCIKDAGNSSPAECKASSIRLYCGRSFYLPLIAVSFMSLVRAATGSLMIQIFCTVIFQMIRPDAPLMEYTTVIVFVLRIAGTLSYVFTVDYFGKRRLACLTLLLTGLSNLTACIFIHLVARGDAVDQVGYWVAVSAILLSNFLACAGYDSIVNVLYGEIFPNKFRNVGAGLGAFANSVALALMSKIFLYIVDIMTLQGVFLMFAVSCIFGSITFHLTIPKTEGKTLMEIEDHYAGVKNLNVDPAVDMLDIKEKGVAN